MLITKGFSSVNENYNLINTVGRYTEETESGVNFKISGVGIKYRSEFDSEFPARPYMEITGTIDSVLANTDTLGLIKVNFDEQDRYESTLVYEFSDEEIANLAAKGLFRKEFQIPYEFENMVVQVPKEVRLDIILMDEENSVPLVFVKVLDSNQTEANREMLGVEFTDLFRAVELEEELNKTADLENFRDIEETEIHKDNEPELEEENELEADNVELSKEDQKTLEMYENIKADAKKLLELNKEQWNKISEIKNSDITNKTEEILKVLDETSESEEEKQEKQVEKDIEELETLEDISEEVKETAEKKSTFVENKDGEMKLNLTEEELKEREKADRKKAEEKNIPYIKVNPKKEDNELEF